MTLTGKSMIRINTRGKVFVIKDRCKGCGLCISMCPTKVLKFSQDINKKGYRYPRVQEEPPNGVCINCGTCILICPDFAIYTIPYKSGEHMSRKVEVIARRPNRVLLSNNN